MRTISRETARRLFILRQRLNDRALADDAANLLAVVRDLGCVQVDPISVVARTQYLVMWSRVGKYDPAALDRLIYLDRDLFEYWAHAASLVLTEDYAIHQLFMRTYATSQPTGAVGQPFQRWLAENKNLQRHILRELKRQGPLPSRAFENKTEAEWYSTGWTSGRDVSQMLDYLWTKGKIMVAGRDGLQKLWDLSERILPDWTPRDRLPEREEVRRSVLKALRALGVATPQHIDRHYTRKRYPHLKETLIELQAADLIEKVRVDGDSAEWFIRTPDLALLDQVERNEIGFERTTLLSPFDNLIADRARTLRLFDFDYKIEIYTPPAKRRYGYYVLPILHGDRLIGRIDPKLDREQGRLHIHAVHAEPGAPFTRAAARSIRAAIEELAAFLGANEILYTPLVPDGWRPVLR